MQADEREPDITGLLGRQIGGARPHCLAIGVSFRDRSSSGASLGRPEMTIGFDPPLREFLAEMAQVRLQAPDHHWVEVTGLDRHAACETLRIKDFKQRRERVRVAVVWGRGQEEPVLEALGEPPDRAGELAVDRVARPAGRRGVMRLIENQQRARPEISEEVA